LEKQIRAGSRTSRPVRSRTNISDGNDIVKKRTTNRRVRREGGNRRNDLKFVSAIDGLYPVDDEKYRKIFSVNADEPLVKVYSASYYYYNGEILVWQYHIAFTDNKGNNLFIPLYTTTKIHLIPPKRLFLKTEKGVGMRIFNDFGRK
jgi:hypothetical protein